MAKSFKVKRPSFQFYPKDWQTDPNLSACSMAARGLWIELMCIMHDSDRYGYLPLHLIDPSANQASICFYTGHESALETCRDKLLRLLDLVPDLCNVLARMVRSTPDEVRDCLIELAKRQVFDFNEEGVLYSKRMVLDEQTRIARAMNGHLGGNPNLVKREGVIATQSKTGIVMAVQGELLGKADHIQPVEENSETGKKARRRRITVPSEVGLQVYDIENPQIELPEGIPHKEWRDFVLQRHQHWKTNKKMPFTVNSARLTMNKLIKAIEEGHDPAKMLNESIERGYVSVFQSQNTLANQGKPSALKSFLNKQNQVGRGGKLPDKSDFESSGRVAGDRLVPIKKVSGGQ